MSRCSKNNRAQTKISNDLAQVRFQFRDSGLDGFPNHIEIQFKVTVRHTVTHALHLMPGNLRMAIDENRMLIKQLSRQFANDQQLQMTASCVFVSARKSSLAIPST